MKTKLAVLLAAVLMAWSLKRHYSAAGVDDLLWILTPTARLVGVVSGATFTLQEDEGYLSREHLFLIEKSCAGVNFMIAAFVMLVFALLRRASSPAPGVRVLAVSFVTAYAAAVLVNTVRIAVAMWLAAHQAMLPALSAADVHRVEGIVVYFGGLVGLYEIARRLDRSGRARLGS